MEAKCEQADLEAKAARRQKPRRWEGGRRSTHCGLPSRSQPWQSTVLSRFVETQRPDRVVHLMGLDASRAGCVCVCCQLLAAAAFMHLFCMFPPFCIFSLFSLHFYFLAKVVFSVPLFPPYVSKKTFFATARWNRDLTVCIAWSAIQIGWDFRHCRPADEGRPKLGSKP